MKHLVIIADKLQTTELQKRTVIETNILRKDESVKVIKKQKMEVIEEKK